MRKARTVMIAIGRKKNLCLMLQAPEALTVYDPVSVALKFRAQVTRLNGLLSALSPAAEHGKRTEMLLLKFLNLLSYAHNITPFLHIYSPLRNKILFMHICAAQ